MSAVLPPTDDAAGLVLSEPAAAELRLEVVERQARGYLDDHIDVERRTDITAPGSVSHSSIVAPPTNMTSSTSSPSATAARSSSSMFTLRRRQARDQQFGRQAPDARTAGPDGVDQRQALAKRGVAR